MAGNITSTKNSSDTIGNRTRDLPACNAVHDREIHYSKIEVYNLVVLSYILHFYFVFILFSLKKTKVTRISRQPLPVKIMVDQKQLESVEYLGSLLTNDGRCACEIKCKIAMVKAAFNKKRTLFTSTLDLELRKKLVKCYIWSIALYGAETWTLRAVD